MNDMTALAPEDSNDSLQTNTQKFEAIAEELLKIPHGEVRDDLSPQDVPEWDSMNYLLFIAEIEKEFAISFTMDEVLNAKTLGDIRLVLEKRT